VTGQNEGKRAPLLIRSFGSVLYGAKEGINRYYSLCTGSCHALIVISTV
jgi:hypothetical protein